MYISYILQSQNNICISDSRVDKRTRSKKTTKKAQITQVKTHTVAQNLQSQSIKFFYFIISVPSPTLDDVNNDYNDTAVWIHRRRFLILSSLSSPSAYLVDETAIDDDDDDNMDENINKHGKTNTIQLMAMIITRSTLLPSSNDRSKITQSLSYQLTTNESKDRVVIIYGDRIQVRKKVKK